MGLGQRSLADIVPPRPGPDITIAGPAPRSRLGGSGQADGLSDINHAQTLAVGDFNADGVQDLAISAPDAELIVGSATRRAGAVYIIFGRKDLGAAIDLAAAQPGGADVTIFGVADGDRFGFALAAGDINGDGITDLVVGAPQVSSSSSAAAGAVYGLLGSRSFGGNTVIDLTQRAPDLLIHGAGDRFGAAIAVGDAGGPTGSRPITDLLIGAPGTSLDSSGSAYLFFGRPEFGTSVREIDAGRAADFTITGSVRQRLGTALAIGDLNGDGQGDLFCGAPGADRSARFDSVSLAPMSATGAVFGLFGPINPGGSLILSQSQASLSLYGFNVADRFGAALAVADLTGDGVADLAVGAPSASGTFRVNVTDVTYFLDRNSGAAYVFAGSRTLAGPRLDVAAEEYSTASLLISEGQMGFSLYAGSYNIPGNADTVPDLIIGIPAAGIDRFHPLGFGAATVLFGGPTLLSTKARPRSPINPPPAPEEVGAFDTDLGRGAGVGFAVAAGDLNGDGAGDLILAAPFAEAAGRAQAGQVLIWLGTAKPPGGGGDPALPTVRVVSPVAGERLVGGQQAVITWSATAVEKVQSFDLLLSTDGGASFPTSIAAGLPASQTSYTWTVPGTCVGSARVEVTATTTGGERVIAVTEGSFAIAQAGPGLDLGRSSINDATLSLTTAAGNLFADGGSVEISTDAGGSSFQGFSRTPKIKGGGRKLKTRGTIDGKGLDQFFPDGAIRIIRVLSAPCATTLVSVRRQGESLVPTSVD